MDAKNFLFKASQGKHSTLDKAYNKHINNLIDTLDEENQGRWETYNMIIQELINEGKEDYFNEIRYRLTDGEDPNKVILDIVDRDLDQINSLIWFLKRRVEEYLEEDYFKRFYE